MKFTKTKIAAVAAILAVTSVAASAALVKETIAHDEFERAVRLQNLSVVAVQNGDYALACRAQRNVADALVKAGNRSHDIYQAVAQQNRDYCQRAGV